MRSPDQWRAKALRHCAQARPPSTATVTVQHTTICSMKLVERVERATATTGAASCMPRDAGRGIIDAPVVMYQVLVAVIIAVQHVWRKQCFRCSVPPPFFSCLRVWLAPHVHQRDRLTECSVAHGAAVAANICCLRPKEPAPGSAARFWRFLARRGANIPNLVTSAPRCNRPAARAWPPRLWHARSTPVRAQR